MTKYLAPMFLVLAACSGEGEACTDNEFSCDGQLLMQCVDGALVEHADCAVDGGECDAAMGHCHMDDTMGTM
ncbi:MAG: hypothetical protein KTR31_00305 [Myxococcales bacterium]|nr:hypothetical protein [Myxococcales bacterium]